MSRKKTYICALTAALLATVIGAQAAKLRWDSHYFDGYDASLPLNPIVEPAEERSSYTRTAFSFEGIAGMRVPTLMARPTNTPVPLPCVIFLHGIGQDKSFTDDIAPFFVQQGFALVCFDQYTRGERKQPGLNAWHSFLALRRRAALNVLETRRLVDYLQTRPDIVPDRIYLVGASFGAITGATAAAFEPRIRAVVLTYGGGDLPVLLGSREAAHSAGVWLGPVKYLGAYLLAPSDPIRYVARIAPRAVLFQNGMDDSLVPAASGQALYEAARDPKEMTWYPGDHIGLDVDTVHRVLEEAVTWLKARDRELATVAGMAPAG